MYLICYNFKNTFKDQMKLYALFALVASASAYRLQQRPAHDVLLDVSKTINIPAVLKSATKADEVQETDDFFKWLVTITNPNDGMTWEDVTTKLTE